jgi:phosphoribosylanthranilate isomerase
MDAPKIKICGMVTQGNILQVAAVHPDFMGFIFYKNSPRYVGEDFQVPNNLSATIKKVGVFVNETFENMMDQIIRHKLDMIQLHGKEAPATCQLLKEAGVEVIKVFSVDGNFNFEEVVPYESVVDYFLFDTKGKWPGGNGVPFDWQTLKNYNGAVPYFLSGGINADNISQISQLQDGRLMAIDINSGVEARPGLKDMNKLNECLKNIKSIGS